jgi:hypothetical protein
VQLLEGRELRALLVLTAGIRLRTLEYMELRVPEKKILGGELRGPHDRDDVADLVRVARCPFVRLHAAHRDPHHGVDLLGAEDLAEEAPLALDHVVDGELRKAKAWLGAAARRRRRDAVAEGLDEHEVEALRVDELVRDALHERLRVPGEPCRKDHDVRLRRIELAERAVADAALLDLLTAIERARLQLRDPEVAFACRRHDGRNGAARSRVLGRRMGARRGSARRHERGDQHGEVRSSHEHEAIVGERHRSRE